MLQFWAINPASTALGTPKASARIYAHLPGQARKSLAAHSGQTATSCSSWKLLTCSQLFWGRLVQLEIVKVGRKGLIWWCRCTPLARAIKLLRTLQWPCQSLTTSNEEVLLCVYIYIALQIMLLRFLRSHWVMLNQGIYKVAHCDTGCQIEPTWFPTFFLEHQVASYALLQSAEEHPPEDKRCTPTANRGETMGSDASFSEDKPLCRFCSVSAGLIAWAYVSSSLPEKNFREWGQASWKTKEWSRMEHASATLRMWRPSSPSLHIPFLTAEGCWRLTPIPDHARSINQFISIQPSVPQKLLMYLPMYCPCNAVKSHAQWMHPRDAPQECETKEDAK